MKKYCERSFRRASFVGRQTFINLRNFVEAVPSNPSKFPKDSNAPTIACKDSEEILLSLDFGQKIESGQIFNRNDIDFNPIFQAIDTSTKFRKFSLNSTEHVKNKVVLQVAEKSSY